VSLAEVTPHYLGHRERLRDRLARDGEHLDMLMLVFVRHEKLCRRDAAVQA
jgi:hypothetical protein